MSWHPAFQSWGTQCNLSSYEIATQQISVERTYTMTFLRVPAFIFILWWIAIQAHTFFVTPYHPPCMPPPPVGPPSVLYIYNEIQIHISRTVSTPRVTVWILLTLISWIMLIFTLSAHRQQTPHDMVVVTAVSVCCRVSACVWWWGRGGVGWCVQLHVCVCQKDCHVVKLICMRKGGLITSLMQIRNAHMHTRTYTPLTAYY